MDYKKSACAPLYQYTLYLNSVRNLSSHTIEHYFRDVRLFLRYVTAKREKRSCSYLEEVSISHWDILEFKNLSREEVQDFFLWQTSVEQVSQRSRARRLASLKSFYHYLEVTYGEIPNPVQQIPSPKIKKTLPIYLLDFEVQQLLEGVSGVNYFRDYAIFLVILSGGLRVSEVVSLNLEDFKENSLRIQGKGGKERQVFLSPQASEAVSEYLEHREVLLGGMKGETAIFLSRRTKKRMAVITLQKMIQKNFDLAGFSGRKLSAHKLRHTAATHLMREGVNIRVIQEILGHESLATTEIYTHVESQDLKNAGKKSQFNLNHSSGLREF